MSEMISDMFNQLRRRTITASSRRAATASSSDRHHPDQYYPSRVGGDAECGSVFEGEGDSVHGGGGGGTTSLVSDLPLSADCSVSSKRSRRRPIGTSSNPLISGNKFSSSNQIGKCSKARSSTTRSNSNSSNAKNSSSFKSVHGFNLVSVIFAMTLILMCSMCCSSKVYNVHWNTSNPM